MRGDRDDVAAERSGTGSRTVRRGPVAASPGLRTAGLAVGFVLAVVATVVVFVTDDPRVLRLAVIGAAWAFVLAALGTARRGGGAAPERDEVAAVERSAAEREAELRLAYELQLEREVAARRELELRVENDVRRETEQAVRADLDALRGEVARVAELRAGLAQLTDLRADLAQLAELRADVGRLRTELTEQLSGEMLVERIMLRTQSIRTAPATAETPAPRTIDAAGWVEPAAELTAARPAIRLADLTVGGATRQFAEVRVETAAAEPPVRSTPAPPPPPLDWLAERSMVEPDEAAPARRSRSAASAEPPESPRDRSATRSLAEPATAAEPSRRHTDAPYRPVAPAEQPTEQRPAVPRDAAPAAGEGAVRLAEILAANGVSPSSGGRRRRRYRDDGETDDVLSRVLGR
ncbi:DUF6779 domain-containing protein [Geodermatophilus sp. SYSU D00703]